MSSMIVPHDTNDLELRYVVRVRQVNRPMKQHMQARLFPDLIRRLAAGHGCDLGPGFGRVCLGLKTLPGAIGQVILTVQLPLLARSAAAFLQPGAVNTASAMGQQPTFIVELPLLAPGVRLAFPDDQSGTPDIQAQPIGGFVGPAGLDTLGLSDNFVSLLLHGLESVFIEINSLCSWKPDHQ